MGITGLTNPQNYTFSVTVSKSYSMNKAYYNSKASSISFSNCQDCAVLGNMYYVTSERTKNNKIVYQLGVIICQLLDYGFFLFMKENFNEDCSNGVISDIGLDLKEVKECLTQSFVGTTYDKQQNQYQKILRNTILDREYQLRKEYLISRVPSITINGRSYFGSWKPEFVFEALCAALTKKPESCYVEEAKGFSFASSFMIIMLVLFINITLFLICKKYIRDKISERISSTDINTRIDTVVNSYVALKEAK